MDYSRPTVHSSTLSLFSRTSSRSASNSFNEATIEGRKRTIGLGFERIETRFLGNDKNRHILFDIRLFDKNGFSYLSSFFQLELGSSYRSLEGLVFRLQTHVASNGSVELLHKEKENNKTLHRRRDAYQN